MEDIRVRFGLRVRELRIENNLSQEKLAELAEIDRTYITGIERGKRNVSITIMEKLANGLKVSLEFLMRGF